jgi:plastocyanin
MLRTLTLIGLAAALSVSAQTTHELVGFDFEFDPPVIDAEQGDSLHIVLSPTTHTFTQVSEETWNANGNTPIGLINIGPGVGEVTIALDASGTLFYVCSPHAAMGMKGIVNVALTSGMRDPEQLRTMALYPNPVRDRLWFREPIPGAVDVFFIDAAGREAGRLQTLGSAPLFVGDLRPGLYLVRVVDGAGEEIFRQQISVEQ